MPFSNLQASIATDGSPFFGAAEAASYNEAVTGRSDQEAAFAFVCFRRIGLQARCSFSNSPESIAAEAASYNEAVTRGLQIKIGFRRLA